LPKDPARSRRSIRGLATVATACGAVAAGIACQARYASPYRPLLESISVPIDPTAPRRSLLRIGFVTDTHIGPAISATDVERAIRPLLDQAPDVFLLGGDFVCESPRFVPEAASVLGECASAAPSGAYAVLGNHDYSNDAGRLINAFEQRGIRVLRNEAVQLAFGSDPVWISGIDDAMLGRPDLDAAFRNVPDFCPVISLWHEPDWAERAGEHGAFLQLSGHSHGGQIRLPVLGNIAAPYGGRRFVSGMTELDSVRVYTSRGVGVYRPPIRFHCPPEVTLVTVS
jgi:predicted MPP superfamily phosphohydrolase